jgi:23S rRNA (cytosine1962-C5)-methyltransferase
VQTIRITKKGVAWFNTGHPWIYKDDVSVGTVSNQTTISRGNCPVFESVVDVVSESNKFLAKAFYNPKSQIALRVITRREEVIDGDFWARRIKKAADYRKDIVGDTNAYRLVFSESDGLPGLVVDRYADVIVVQFATLGMDLIKEDIADILTGIFRPKAIVARNDFPTRRLEGLVEEKTILSGRKPERVEVFEGDVKYLADVWDGHKTGVYLDQRENRLMVGNLIRGRTLDAFCYQGGFTLHLAKRAREVVSLDSSQPALDILDKNLQLNGIRNVTKLHANVFDKLKEFSAAGERFDFIVLDPPPFAKSKGQIGGARRGYKDLNLRATQCLNEGGYLATFSCSYNYSEEEFLHSIRLAAADAKKELRVLAKLGQAKDHPPCVTFPESNYLKGFMLQLYNW